MADELDLSVGDPSQADPDSSAERRRRRRRERSGSSSSSGDKKQSSDLLGEIQSQLNDVWDRIAEWREARDDHELANVIREDAPMMTRGTMGLASRFALIRLPLLITLSIIGPVLAFGRVGRILRERFVSRQHARAEARAAAAAEWEMNGGGAEVPVA